MTVESRTPVKRVKNTSNIFAVLTSWILYFFIGLLLCLALFLSIFGLCSTNTFPLLICTWLLKNQIVKIDFDKLDLSLQKSILKLIFVGYTGSKNQVRTRKKIKFDLKWFFFQVCNKLPNWHFKNQAQIDIGSMCQDLTFWFCFVEEYQFRSTFFDNIKF